MTKYYDYRQDPNSEVAKHVEDESMRVELPSLETIDAAILEWVRSKNLQVSKSLVGGGFKPVPVMWSGTERAYQTKMMKEYHDETGALILPIITISQEGDITKSLSDKGQHWANVPAIRDFMGGVLPVGKKIVHKKTSEFQNNRANNITGQMNYRFSEDFEEPRIVYEHHLVPIPVYVSVPYQINIWTSFKQHMNEILQPFLTQQDIGNLNRFVLGYNGHNFEAFFEENVGNEGNSASMEDNEREFKRTLNVRVLGHIVGEGTNQQTPKKVHREGHARVKIGKEVIIRN